ncbi:hypothetical protein Q8F55_000242 [Vanrija albida]|uniref:Nucleolar 27S pre-rRNA processing Urb2/Npa2 C-terminal domain-containing protein n=1 Tax=Vanrija albida TaxID=181172 RepID=A0ABR3QCV0_9TREE
MATPEPLSGSTLIKALKGAADPTPSGERKIALAAGAWADGSLLIPRKADVLRDWVLEAWMRSKPTWVPLSDLANPRSASPLLDPAYHDLLVAVTPSCAAPPAAPLSLLATYIAAAGAGTPPPALGGAVAASLSQLFHTTEGSKADAWADIWAKLVGALASPSAAVDALAPVAALVCDALAATLPTSPNGKKIAQGLHASLPAYAAALAHHPELRPVFEPLTGALLFPLAALQTLDPLKPLLAALAPAPTGDALPALGAIPHLFATFIAATVQQRYTLYARGADRRPIDVVVADKVRAAVTPALGAALEFVNRLEDSVLSRPGSSTPSGAVVEGLWSSRLALWTAFHAWGGYLETDAAAGQLVANEAQRAASALALYGASEAAAEDEGLAGRILRTLDVLERLDHARTDVNTEVVGWCLASPARTHPAARTLLSSILRFHQLTRSLDVFFDLVSDACAGLFDASLPSNALSTLYSLVAVGPLTDKAFRDDLAAAVRATNLGGRRSVQWAALLDGLSARVRAALAGVEVGSKRKREALDGPARLVAVLSRLVKIVLDAGARARPGLEDVEAAVGAAARAFADAEAPSAAGDADAPKKKRKSDVGARDVAADLAFAARLRAARSAGLIHRKAEYALDAGALCSLLEAPGIAPELQLEITHYIYTRLALYAHDADEHRAAAVDALLHTLDLSPKRAWTGRDAAVTDKTLAAAAWTIVAQGGLSPLDVTATPAQLDKLVALIVARAGGDADGLSVSAAIQRLLSSADTWELPAVRTALLKALVESAAGKSSRGAFVVLATCPTPWLSKGARAALLDAAYAVDKDASAETQTAIRKWLARLAKSADVYGPLATDAKLVKKLLKSATEPELADATLALVDLAYTHIAKAAARDPAVLLATLDEAIKSKPFAKWAEADPATDVRSRAVALLLDDIVAAGPVDRYDAAVRAKLAELEAVARSALAPAVARALETSPASHAAVFTTWRSLARFAAWLGAAPAADSTGAALLSALVRARDAPPDLPVVAFDLASSAAPDALAAFIVLRAAFPSDQLDAAFAAYAKTLPADAFATALSSAAALLAAPRDREVEGALRAVSLLLSAPVEGSGRAIATLLHPLLLAIEAAIQRGSAGVIAEALRALSALVEDRTGLLRAPDGALVLSAIAAALAPSATHAPTSAPHLVPLALAPLITLVRHRADIALAHLPALVGALAAFLPLLQRARGKRSKAAKRPFWLALDPAADDPAASHAALLARAFTNLATAKLPTAGDAPARTLAGPAAKHAPALLVAYARAAADPWAGLGTAVRRELEPGLFSICDIVTAGGRADGRGREGEGVGTPFGLGDGAGGAAEHEIWADTWRAWSRKRYTGQG